MRRYVSIFNEKAISASEVKANKNLCLDIYKDSVSVIIILYDKSKIGFKNDEIKFADDCIYIYGEMKRDRKTPFKCWQTSRTAASAGYGAFLYDTMLSMAGDDGLIPDRVSVSKAAKKVWEYYFTVRKNEFDLFKLDDQSKPATPDKKDDTRIHYPNSPYNRRHYIDYRYIWKNFQAHLSSIKPLLDNHKKFISKVEAKGIDLERFLKDLYDEGDGFFNVKYYS